MPEEELPEPEGPGSLGQQHRAPFRRVEGHTHKNDGAVFEAHLPSRHRWPRAWQTWQKHAAQPNYHDYNEIRSDDPWFS